MSKEDFEVLEILTEDHKIEDSHNNKRQTSPYMTCAEYTRLLTVRALQITAGIQPKLDPKEYEGIYNPIEIAKIELHARKNSLIIQRILPNGEKENWKVKDMNIIDY